MAAVRIPINFMFFSFCFCILLWPLIELLSTVSCQHNLQCLNGDTNYRVINTNARTVNGWYLCVCVCLYRNLDTPQKLATCSGIVAKGYVCNVTLSLHFSTLVTAFIILVKSSLVSH